MNAEQNTTLVVCAGWVILRLDQKKGRIYFGSSLIHENENGETDRRAGFFFLLYILQARRLDQKGAGKEKPEDKIG